MFLIFNKEKETIYFIQMTQQLLDWCKIWISFYFNLPGEEMSFTQLLFIYRNIKVQNISLHHHFQWLKTATVFCISTIDCIIIFIIIIIFYLLVSSWITKKPLCYYAWELNITCEQYFYPGLGLLINESETVNSIL